MDAQRRFAARSGEPFLKNIFAFEAGKPNTALLPCMKKLVDLPIGLWKELSPSSQRRTEAFTDIMESHQICLTFVMAHMKKVIYKFITEELFAHEMIWNLCLVAIEFYL